MRSKLALSWFTVSLIQFCFLFPLSPTATIRLIAFGFSFINYLLSKNLFKTSSSVLLLSVKWRFIPELEVNCIYLTIFKLLEQFQFLTLDLLLLWFSVLSLLCYSFTLQYQILDCHYCFLCFDFHLKYVLHS